MEPTHATAVARKWNVWSQRGAGVRSTCAHGGPVRALANAARHYGIRLPRWGGLDDSWLGCGLLRESDRSMKHGPARNVVEKLSQIARDGDQTKRALRATARRTS